MEKLKVGEMLYDGKAMSHRVNVVGKKFYKVGDRNRQVFIETLLENCNFGSPTQFYISQQEILDRNEKISLEDKIRTVMKPYGTTILTLDQLRKIKAIIGL